MTTDKTLGIKNSTLDKRIKIYCWIGTIMSGVLVLFPLVDYLFKFSGGGGVGGVGHSFNIIVAGIYLIPFLFSVIAHKTSQRRNKIIYSTISMILPTLILVNLVIRVISGGT